MLCAFKGHSGAGMMYGYPVPLILAREPRISDQARRLIVLRNWVDQLMERPEYSAWFETELARSESRLRDQAQFIIGWGC
jgi:hypothetical protein